MVHIIMKLVLHVTNKENMFNIDMQGQEFKVTFGKYKVIFVHKGVEKHYGKWSSFDMTRFLIHIPIDTWCFHCHQFQLFIPSFRAGWHRVQLLKLLASLGYHVIAIDYRGMYICLLTSIVLHSICMFLYFKAARMA